MDVIILCLIIIIVYVGCHISIFLYDLITKLNRCIIIEYETTEFNKNMYNKVCIDSDNPNTTMRKICKI